MKKSIFDYICEKALPIDDTGKIAQYIHLTDEYIYPTICKDPQDEDWKKLIKECFLKEDSVFFWDYITVAKDGFGEIVGILCAVPCGKRLTFSDGINVPHGLQDTLPSVNEGYFDPLVKETLEAEGYCITNVCVDEKHRGHGIGSRLLEYCVREYGDRVLFLDVIAHNENAIALYRKFGFEITKEYYGFSGTEELLLCYQMVRLPLD